MANNWSRDLNPREVLAFIIEHPGATTLETKSFFACESRNVRKAMGILMQHNKVLPMPYGQSISWIPVTGKKGRPNPKTFRDGWVHYKDDDTGKFVGRDIKFERLKAEGKRGELEDAPLTASPGLDDSPRVKAKVHQAEPDEWDSPFDA